MRTIMRLLRQSEFHIFIFCLLFILFNWPFLAIPAREGVLSFFVFLFVLWSAVVLLLFFIAKSLRSGNGSGKEGGN